MKKLLSVLLAVLMVFTLCACAKNNGTSENIISSNNASVSESIPAISETPAAEPDVTSGQPNAPPSEEQSIQTSEAADSPTIELPTDEAPEEIASVETEPADSSVSASESPDTPVIDENGSYTRRDDVALYIHTYGHLPQNFITKKDAQALGWSGGSLEPYAPGKCIGGSHFGNYEGLLPEKAGRSYTECDIDTLGKSSRGAKRIVFSNDGLIYYTDDHYESFTLLYGEE